MTMWIVLQRVLAGILLALLSPLLLLIGLAIRIDSSGPALYRARRMGLGGSEITVHKFRTMRWAPSRGGPPVTFREDPRVTRIGRRLRSSRLDELPQLWDVARGAMVFIGPRPEAPEFVDITDPRWVEVLSVRPGIAGLTQLAFLHEARALSATGAVDSYRTEILPKKLASDLRYVRTRTVSEDVRIMVRTARVLMSRD